MISYSPNDKLLLDFLKGNPGSTNREIIAGTSVSRAAVYRRLSALVKARVLSVEVDGASKRYAVLGEIDEVRASTPAPKPEEPQEAPEMSPLVFSACLAGLASPKTNKRQRDAIIASPSFQKKKASELS